jgi:hypothetical protein
MMNRTWWQGGVSLLPVVLVTLIGCSKDASKDQLKEKVTTPASAKADDSQGWWCAEHGVPEENCGQCNAAYAAECKRKGDWCKEHDRPESQCFICQPKLKEKFAAMYRAKYGKEPPSTGDAKN